MVDMYQMAYLFQNYMKIFMLLLGYLINKWNYPSVAIATPFRHKIVLSYSPLNKNVSKREVLEIQVKRVNHHITCDYKFGQKRIFGSMMNIELITNYKDKRSLISY